MCDGNFEFHRQFYNETIQFFVAFGFVLRVAWIGVLDWRIRSTGVDDLKIIITQVFFYILRNAFWLN